MHRFFVPQSYGETMTITGVDARHIYTVLRMQTGTKVQIVSEDGVSAVAEIARGRMKTQLPYVVWK